MGKNRAVTLGSLAAVLTVAAEVSARPPADDFLNPQDPGPRLTLMPFVGPGFRAIYDHRFELEEDITELRTQLMGTVAFPFAEASANIDLRLFLLTFGASAGYHQEWHLLRFEPDPRTGFDSAGVLPAPGQNFAPGFSDLNRSARRVKDQNTDVGSEDWAFYEGRVGFLWPAQNFMGVSTLAARQDGRPDVTFDWENATVLNGGWHLRWESYALFRHPKIGFAGPALRALYVPRNHVRGDFTIASSGAIVPDGSACQASNPHIPCVESYEVELQYGLLAGLRPGLTDIDDVLLVRAFLAFGVDTGLFGTHTFGAPLQLLVAYAFSIE